VHHVMLGAIPQQISRCVRAPAAPLLTHVERPHTFMHGRWMCLRGHISQRDCEERREVCCAATGCSWQMWSWREPGMTSARCVYMCGGCVGEGRGAL
jgi:hypothetical protein